MWLDVKLVEDPEHAASSSKLTWFRVRNLRSGSDSCRSQGCGFLDTDSVLNAYLHFSRISSSAFFFLMAF